MGKWQTRILVAAGLLMSVKAVISIIWPTIQLPYSNVLGTAEPVFPEFDFQSLSYGLVFFALAGVFEYGRVLQEDADEILLGGGTVPIVMRLDRVMADRKISSQELAEIIGISPVNLSRIKTGRLKGIRFSTLQAMCEALHCKPGDIIDWMDDDEYAAAFGKSDGTMR